MKHRWRAKLRNAEGDRREIVVETDVDLDAPPLTVAYLRHVKRQARASGWRLLHLQTTRAH